MERKTSHGESKSAWLDKPTQWMRIQKIKKYIPREGKLLDAGCGYRGDLLQWFQGDKLRCEGIDLSVDSSNKLLISGDLNKELPFENNTFDIITSLAVLEHLDNPIGHLEELYRILKPGGKLLLTTPTPYAKPVLEFLAYKLGIANKAEIDDHKHYFSKQELIDLFNKLGFVKVRHKYFQIYMNQIIVSTK